MAAGNTYEAIATQTLGSAAASVTFSSIPSTYTDLVLVTNEKQTSGSFRASAIQFNGDTASNYSMTEMYGDGGTAGSTRLSNYARIYYAYDVYADTTNFDLVTVTHLMNYSNTTTYKTILTRASNASGGGTSAMVGLWRSTAAINSIYLYLDNLSNFAAGSTFSLYGIKAA